MDGTGSGSCSLAGLYSNRVELSGSVTREFVTQSVREAFEASGKLTESRRRARC